MKITDISDADLFVNAKFAIINKNDTIAEYRELVAKGQFRLERCKVTESVRLSAEEYQDFTDTLLTDREWLTGKGGHDSTADLPSVDSFWQYSEEQQKVWKEHAYRLVLAVSAPDRATIYVDPQGYTYARYVGI